VLPPHRSLAAASTLFVIAILSCSPDSTSPTTSTASSDASAADRSSGSSVGFQHQPTGFTTLTVNTANVFPPFSGGWYSSLPGAWKMNQSSTATLISDASAPCSPPTAWSATYRAGLAAGSGPITLWGQSGATVKESRKWYVRACIKVGNAGGYENQSWGTKMWFGTVGDSPSAPRCSIIPVIKGDGKQAVKSSWTAMTTFECGGVLPTVNFYQIPSAGRPIKSDTWQVHEWLIDAGDIDQKNGRFQWWIDGVLVIDKQGQKFRTAASGRTHGLSVWRWTPTWGGMNGVRTRTDYYKIDDVYVSAWGTP